MKKHILLSLVVCLFIFNYSFALDWRLLHEKADSRSLEQSLEAAANNPVSLEDNYILGLVYLNAHKDKEAQGLFAKILEQNPGIIEGKWGVAESLRRQHKLKEAQKLLDEVIKAQNSFYPAYVSLAYIKYIHLDFNESARLALEVIRAGKERVDLTNYARAYCIYAGAKGMIAHYGGPVSKLINGTAVRSNLEKAQSLQPDSFAAVFGLGTFYLLAPRFAGGDLDKAEEYLKRAIKIDPLYADAYLRLAQVYKIKGDKTRFEQYFNQASEIDPGNELVLDMQSGACRYICAGGKD